MCRPIGSPAARTMETPPDPGEGELRQEARVGAEPDLSTAVLWPRHKFSLGLS